MITYPLYRHDRFGFGFVEQIDGISDATAASCANGHFRLGSLPCLIGSFAILGELLGLFTIQAILLFAQALLFGRSLLVGLFLFFGKVLEASA